MISGKIEMPKRLEPHSKRRIKIEIATPAYGSVYSSCYVRTLYTLLNRGNADGIAFALSEIDYSDIVVARNYLISNFYFNHKDCTHLLFLDSDMGFPYHFFRAMLALREDVVGALYPKRSLDLEAIHRAGHLSFGDAYQKACTYIGGPPGRSHSRDDSFFEVPRCGTGILLISRSCVEQLLLADPGLLDARRHQGFALFDQKLPGGVIALFDKMVVDGKELSEDFSFCERWRSLCTGSIWASKPAGIEHAGDLVVVSNGRTR
jgi:hypothetical protein